MILIIGGCYQGKTTFAKNEFNLKDTDIISGENINIENLKNIKCIDNLHFFIKKCLLGNIDVTSEIEKIKNINKEIIFICDEVGSGIVPMGKEERVYRDLVGSVCCNLAKDSEKVIRMFAAIPTVIKG